MDEPRFECSDGIEHFIGQDALDSGHGARPVGPQKCLNCGVKLDTLVYRYAQQMVVEARIDEIDRLIDSYYDQAPYTSIRKDGSTRRGRSGLRIFTLKDRLKELKSNLDRIATIEKEMEKE